MSRTASGNRLRSLVTTLVLVVLTVAIIWVVFTRDGGFGAVADTDEAPALTAEQAAPDAAPPASIPAGALPAVVDYVHDGDTLFLADGRKVRLLGIDTPEVSDGGECFGVEARDALRGILPEGTEIRVLPDVNPEDRFGRSLLHVYLPDGTFVNRALIDQGYAEALIIRPNLMFADEFEAAEDAAAASGVGLWSACR